jgi:hypothetical protein
MGLTTIFPRLDEWNLLQIELNYVDVPIYVLSKFKFLICIFNFKKIVEFFDQTFMNKAMKSFELYFSKFRQYNDPAPSTIFAHLDATTVLSKGLATKGIYPAVDPD